MKVEKGWREDELGSQAAEGLDLICMLARKAS